MLCFYPVLVITKPVPLAALDCALFMAETSVPAGVFPVSGQGPVNDRRRDLRR